MLLGVLAGMGVLSDRLQSRDDAVGSVAASLQAAGLNLEAREEQAAGYYEGLLNEGARVSRMNPRLGSGAEVPLWGIGSPERRSRDDFLVYDMNPNVHLEGALPLLTNSEGLADKEYSRARRPGVRRIALIGDSIARGQGAPPGRSFEARLEEDLALHAPCPGPPPEIINFAVSGYQITQLLDVLPTRARAFNPDVYAIALTEISVSRRWSDHLTTIIRQGRDPKYPFLEKVIRESRVSPTDPQRTMRAKLSRFRFDVFREVITQMKQLAAEDHANLVLLLVPSGRAIREVRENFAGVPELLRSLDVNVVNLLRTFAHVPDVSVVRVSDADIHPNAAGHALLFKALRGAVDAPDGRVRTLLLGDSCRERS